VDVPEGFEVRTDVCVIGSGAGGGVAAAVLAQSMRDVLVLEEGPNVTGDEMTQREEEMYPLLYRDGGEQMTSDGGIAVLQGRAVGGSTVVNMADVVGISDGVLAHWAAHLGVDRYPADAVQEAAEVCMEVIEANRIPAALVNRNNAVLLEGAAALGIEGDTFVNNRVGCVECGYCNIGCTYDAKRSVALTWIPKALDTGRVTVQADARVERLEWSGSRVTAVVGSVVRPPHGHAVAPFRVEADHFVLSAGAVHSPILLMRSGLDSGQVGRNLSLQPQVPVAAVFASEVVLFRGIPQSTYLDSAERVSAEAGLGGFRLEGVSAGPGMTAANMAFDAHEVHEFMGRFRHVAACLCLVPDRPSGRVDLGEHGRPEIHHTLSPEVHTTLMEAMATAARVYLAAGAEMVMLPFQDATPVRSETDLEQLARMRIQSTSTPLISAHPQGTCRMGPDPSSSVVGLDLFVHGIENLQVLDASIFPTTSSSHTMLPVMTFAWLGAREAAGR
jgi:choline dehydrogenase-like flavoprotein